LFPQLKIQRSGSVIDIAPQTFSPGHSEPLPAEQGPAHPGLLAVLTVYSNKTGLDVKKRNYQKSSWRYPQRATPTYFVPALSEMERPQPVLSEPKE